MSVPAIYQQLVLGHSREPRRFGGLDAPTHAADGANPLCGDHLRVQVRVVDERVVGFAFSGEACAIARAAASMLGDQVMGRDVAEVERLAADIASVVRGESTCATDLGDLHALAALSHYPSRQKCALLASATLCAALAGSATATTELDIARRKE
ncbi:MAG: Fe-S cluster assembly sulfur transfer protein SufU [Rudaea sp.]